MSNIRNDSIYSIMTVLHAGRVWSADARHDFARTRYSYVSILCGILYLERVVIPTYTDAGNSAMRFTRHVCDLLGPPDTNDRSAIVMLLNTIHANN